MAETLRVTLSHHSYDIVIGERLLTKAGQYIKPILPGNNVIIISDETVAKFYLHRLVNSLEEEGIRHRSIIVKAGEATKSLDNFTALMEQLLEQKPDRKTVLIALGGGVIGDLTGFAASVLLRGVPFIQIPTTLLAQVDSSVGGKTGINSKWGKNLIGSFHQPLLVLSDTATLTTLPPRELLAGYAEVLKYALISDAAFFDWLDTHTTTDLSQAIYHSCKAKASIVEADEKEQKDIRALLNLGHTFGHALEAECGYDGTLLHGEAVAIGMVMAFELSAQLGLCPASDVEKIKAHYAKTGLPASPLTIRTHWNIDALMEHFTRDKKAYAGKLTFILARGIGQSYVARDVDSDAIRQLLVNLL